MRSESIATIALNGKDIEIPIGHSVLEAAGQAGIEIPTLCHHRDLTPTGSCRLCLVEVDGYRDPQPACSTPVAEGMRIRTETPGLAEIRRQILEMLLVDYVGEDGFTTHDSSSEFARWVQRYGAQLPSATKRRFAVDSDPNPFIQVDLNKCILCTRCVRACDEIQGRFVWGIADRGHEARLIAGQDSTMLDARCESCGACAAYCPTGALEDRESVAASPPDRLVRTTCGYCGVGCQFDLNVKDGCVTHVTSTPDAPVNGMSLCVKGRYGFDFIHHPDRLLRPRVRQYLLDSTAVADRPSDRGRWVDVDWDTALNLVARRLSEIRCDSGADAVGLLSSAKCTNEENYLLQKFARQVIGTNNVDHCARLCHSSTVAGLAMAMGSGAMSNSMDDVAQHAQALFIIGSNTTEQHPVFGAMLRQAVLRRGAKLVVADPRRVDIAEHATVHLRHSPGTDVALLNGLMFLILENQWHDSEFIRRRCEGFEEFRATIDNYPPDTVTAITGVDESALREAAEILGHSHPMAVIWAMGITQHTSGVMNVLSLANLQMLLGNMGIPGGGVNPLRGQNNVQGACDMGALPNVFPGYQSVTDLAVHQKFAEAWALAPLATYDRETESSGLAHKPGLTVTEMIEAAGGGKVRALYILGEDPAMTEPDSGHARQCLENTEYIVLQEIFPSETSEYADVLLPGASFAEKSGTFTNTERRIQPLRKAIEPVGDARPDWQIVTELALRLLKLEGQEPTGPQAAWDYLEPGDILRELSQLTPSYAGVTPERIEAGVRLQWPVLGTDHPGTPILHIENFTRGKGKFHAVDHLPARELPDDEYPFLLTTGRVIYHWHGGEMTRRSEGLLAIWPEPAVEMHPHDATRLGIQEGQRIRVDSRRGSMEALAMVTDRVSEGIVFGNFHFPGKGNVNNLTINALDPVAKIPEYKVCAVELRSLEPTQE